MRVDGRKADQLRPVVIVPNYSTFAEGSCLVEFGLTRVLCNASLQEGVPRWITSSGRSGGWVTGEYAMLPRATHQRTPRETNGLSGRTQEIKRLIGRSLRAAVNLELLGAHTLTIDCDVLQADGGTRTAAITGGYVALALALHRLIQAGAVPPQVLLSPVAAVSVGLVDGEPLLDLCYAEDSHAQADANLVMNAAGQFIEVQCSAEMGAFDRRQLDQLMSLAEAGIQQLFAIQAQIIQSAVAEQKG